jgi:hypothetical protein
MEDARLIHLALRHQKMEMRVEIDTLPEGLDDRDNTGLECFPRRGLKIGKKRLDGTAAKIAQEPKLELEKDAQHLGDREDHLAMRNVQEERLPQPLTPFFQPLGMTGGTEPPGLVGKHQKMFRPAAWAPDPGKPAAGIAAIEIFFDNILDDRPEIPIFPLKTALVFRDESFKIMKEHPIEDCLLRMTRAIYSCHSRNVKSRIEPCSCDRQNQAERPQLKSFMGKTASVDVNRCCARETGNCSRS